LPKLGNSSKTVLFFPRCRAQFLIKVRKCSFCAGTVRFNFDCCRYQYADDNNLQSHSFGGIHCCWSASCMHVCWNLCYQTALSTQPDIEVCCKLYVTHPEKQTVLELVEVREFLRTFPIQLRRCSYCPLEVSICNLSWFEQLKVIGDRLKQLFLSTFCNPQNTFCITLAIIGVGQRCTTCGRTAACCLR